MNQILFKTAILLIVLLHLFGTQAKPADNDSIEKRDSELVSAWNSGDVQKMVGFWLSNGSLSRIDGSYAKGLAEIEKTLSEQRSRFLNSHLVSFIEGTYSITSDSTIVIGSRVLNFRESSNKMGRTIFFPYVTSWKKVQNQWKIFVDHWFIPRFAANNKAELFQSSAPIAALGATSDRSIVETEIALAAMSKVADWVKLLVFFVLAPLALTLGFLGLKSYSDVRKFSKRLEHEQSEALRKIREHQEAFNQASLLLQKFKEEISDRRAQLEEASKVLPELRALGSKVDELEKVVKFKPSPILTPDIQQHLNAAVHEFYKYFEGLGFHSSHDVPEVIIDPKLEHAPYYAGNQIVIPSSMAMDENTILKLYVHHVLSSSRALPQHQPGVLAVQYGLAFYFPSSFKNESITDQRRFVEIPPGKEYDPGTAMDVGSILSGAFWELRELLGSEEADAILFSSWIDPKPTSKDDRHPIYFVETILDKSQSICNVDRENQIIELFKTRGIELS